MNNAPLIYDSLKNSDDIMQRIFSSAGALSKTLECTVM